MYNQNHRHRLTENKYVAKCKMIDRKNCDIQCMYIKHVIYSVCI